MTRSWRMTESSDAKARGYWTLSRVRGAMCVYSGSTFLKKAGPNLFDLNQASLELLTLIANLETIPK